MGSHRIEVKMVKSDDGDSDRCLCRMESCDGCRTNEAGKEDILKKMLCAAAAALAILARRKIKKKLG